MPSSLPSTNEPSSLLFDGEQGWSQEWAERPCKLRNPSLHGFGMVADNVEKISHVFCFFSSRSTWFAVFSKRMQSSSSFPALLIGDSHGLPRCINRILEGAVICFRKTILNKSMTAALAVQRLANLFPCPLSCYFVKSSWYNVGMWRLWLARRLCI
jgi:hypothetical protein